MISPLDGRYRSIVQPLEDLLSEQALNRARIMVEVEWLIFLSASGRVPELRALTDRECEVLRAYHSGFGDQEAAELAGIEAVTQHDVKAVEYYLKQKMSITSMADVGEFVHFCCTSEDINNLSYGMLLAGSIREVWMPAASGLVDDIAGLAVRHRDSAMLARTHGQPATPTTMGKELAVFAHRLRRQLHRVRSQTYLGKFNGATGTYSAHVVACPDVNWMSLSRSFVESLGLEWNPLTTQIEPHDYMAELFTDLARFNRILINFNTDMWQYISLGYFRQDQSAESVGSSTMPHKINPIRFENSEANLEVSIALLDCLSANLVVSRLQRDLSDSSLERNIGSALGYSLIGIVNTRRGLSSVELAAEVLADDLDRAWEVLGEACQSVMRRAGYAEPYERLKDLTRGAKVTERRLREFVRQQALPADDEAAMLKLTPATYIGHSSRLVDYLEPGT